MLDRHAERIFAEAGPVTSVVELGPGSGEKLATLISARTVRNVRVHLVDVSSEALEQASRTLGVLPDLSVLTHQATYEAGLASIGQYDGGSGSSLVVFLGSNIGNFDPAAADALLLAIRAAVRRGDSLLLGADLVKPEAELVLAYDDPLGVTAAFNRNLLVRLNRELGSDFDLGGFVHRARWNADQSRVEIHLVSTRRQRVHIPAVDLDITFEDGETIWTETVQVSGERSRGHVDACRVPGDRSVGRRRVCADARGSGVDFPSVHRQVFVHEAHGHRSFANDCSDTVHRS